MLVYLLLQVNVNNTGFYTCVAESAAGKTVRNFTMDVYGMNRSSWRFFWNRLYCESFLEKFFTFSYQKESNFHILLLKRLKYYMTNEWNVLNRARLLTVFNGFVWRHQQFENKLIADPPNIRGSDRISRPTVVQGDNLTLPCLVTGTPPPDITWYLGKYTKFQPYLESRQFWQKSSKVWRCVFVVYNIHSSGSQPGVNEGNPGGEENEIIV